MNIVLYVPDNRITKNYMPVLWPWLLKALTPGDHRVTIMDGNAERLAPQELASVMRSRRIDLVGIGGMTRTIQTAYDAADEIRKLGIPVIMGGPHVSSDGGFLGPDPDEITKEALEHCDSVIAGEADEIWPKVLGDAQAGRLAPRYRAASKPDLRNYPRIPWEEANLNQFSIIPDVMKRLVRASGYPEFDFNLTPVETGRGCPYGCEFCTVTNFFGEKVRVRSIDSVVQEILLLKELRRRFIFFVDDNFAIYDKFGHIDTNLKDHSRRLMQAMIDAKATVPWAAQISSNLLDPETPDGRELVDLMRGAKCIGVYVGLESVLPASLKDVSKSFNKPATYARTLSYLHRSGIYAVTGFIYGMDSDRVGVAKNTWEFVRQYPPSTIPVFSQLTPLPGTPQFAKLRQEGRLVEKHWRDYRPYTAAFRPKQMSEVELRDEVRSAWSMAYAPEAIYDRMRGMRDRPLFERLIIFVANMCFRGVFFPQMNLKAWLRLFWENRKSFWEVFCRSRRLTRRIQLDDAAPRARDRARVPAMASGRTGPAAPQPACAGNATDETNGLHDDTPGPVPSEPPVLTA
ncbi:MAG: radical SAM protein [Acidobacteriota bacterium]